MPVIGSLKMNRDYDSFPSSDNTSEVQQNRQESEEETHRIVGSVSSAQSLSDISQIFTGENFERPSGELPSIHPIRGRNHDCLSIELANPISNAESCVNTDKSNRSAQVHEFRTENMNDHDISQRDESSVIQRQIQYKDNKNADEESIRSENTFLPRRDLGTFDVAALIINKQIGTGIFTTPGLVLSLAGSKSTSIVMWICGGIWALLSVIIYVEFGAAFPFNGGELIYLDEVFRKPELLATALFAAFFILIENTTGNSIQFAKHVLLAAEPSVTDTHQFDKRLLTYVAISVLTVVCLIHYLSRNSGLFLNLLFAIFKIIFVITFIIGGLCASTKPDNGRHDWGLQHGSADSQGSTPTSNVIAGMIYVIYSYQGWENANYVGGELKVARSSLKRGAFLAVGLVTVLYSLIIWAYYYALKYDDLVNNDLAIMVNFVPKAFGHRGVLAAKICIALSAFGNLIAVIYTSAKVKQQTARQCIIPFYKFLAAEDGVLRTPYGALILHWAFAVVWVACTPNSPQGYGFVIGLYIYGQLVVGAFVSFAFFFIRRNYESGLTRNNAYNSEASTWNPVVLKNKTVRLICAVLYMTMNILVLIEASRMKSNPPSWIWATMIFSLLALAILLWAGLRLIASRSGPQSSIEIRILRDGVEKPSLKDFPVLQKAKLEGNSRVVIYEVHGQLERILRNLDVYFHKTIRLLSR